MVYCPEALRDTTKPLEASSGMTQWVTSGRTQVAYHWMAQRVLKLEPCHMIHAPRSTYSTDLRTPFTVQPTVRALQPKYLLSYAGCVNNGASSHT